MSTPLATFHRLSDQDLLCEVMRLAAREREATACLVASLAVLDQRRLYLADGYGSMFAYCTQSLHLSEAAAYKRITVARAAQHFPVILERLAEGAVSLATVSLLAAHLTVENHVTLLDEVRHRRKREVEEIVARLQPRPDVPNTVRKLPAPKSPAPAACTTEALAKPADTPSVDPPSSGLPMPSSPTADRTCSATLETSAGSNTREAVEQTTTTAARGTVTPLAPARYKLTITIGAETYEKLRQAQDLLGHAVPNGDLALLLDRALTLLLQDAAKTKLAATDAPRASHSSSPRSRWIPAAVKRKVWARDGGQCAFVSASGHRCTERGRLEFHHVVPYGKGGGPSVENIQLRCRRHNAYEAERDFGSWATTYVREERPLYGSNQVSVRETLPCSRGRSPASAHAETVSGISAALPGASSIVRAARKAECCARREAAALDRRKLGHFSGSPVNGRSRPAWRSRNRIALLAPFPAMTARPLIRQGRRNHPSGDSYEPT